MGLNGLFLQAAPIGTAGLPGLLKVVLRMQPAASSAAGKWFSASQRKEVRMATVANHTAVAVPLTGQQMRADFQQNPLGRLGDRNVQVANAGAPRHGARHRSMFVLALPSAACDRPRGIADPLTP